MGIEYQFALSICAILISVVIYVNIFAKKSDPTLKPSTKVLQDISTGLQREERESESVVKEDSVLNIAKFRQFKVLKVIKVNYNTKIIRFELPPGGTLGLSIGRHVSVRGEVDGNHVIRPYTPISKPDQSGYFDLLVKKYDNGKLSPFIHALKVGSSLDIRGPTGRYRYQKNAFKRIGLIAGGSGLTPCLQVIRFLLESEEMKGDTTNMTLLFQNRTDDDVLLRDELEDLQKSNPSRFNVLFFITNSPGESRKIPSNERRGYINKEVIQEFLNPAICQHVCVCGPSGFNDSMNRLLIDCGHTDDKAIFLW
jgi:cytochrome-b5 reductase